MRSGGHVAVLWPCTHLHSQPFLSLHPEAQSRSFEAAAAWGSDPDVPRYKIRSRMFLILIFAGLLSAKDRSLTEFLLSHNSVGESVPHCGKVLNAEVHF